MPSYVYRGGRDQEEVRSRIRSQADQEDAARRGALSSNVNTWYGQQAPKQSDADRKGGYQWLNSGSDLSARLDVSSGDPDDRTPERVNRWQRVQLGAPQAQPSPAAARAPAANSGPDLEADLRRRRQAYEYARAQAQGGSSDFYSGMFSDADRRSEEARRNLIA